jgi:hypothetical protein
MTWRSCLTNISFSGSMLFLVMAVVTSGGDGSTCGEDQDPGMLCRFVRQVVFY